MNSNFNENQIVAYAKAFEEGDAIYCNGEWHQVVEIERDKEEGWTARLTAYVDGNNKIISFGTGRGVVLEGFLHDLVTNPYRVTTLADHELQGGEKVIPMSGFMDYIDFGKVYHVKLDSHGTPIVTDDVGIDFVPVGKNWAVVPRYEQVQSIEQKEVKTSNIANALYKRYYNVLQNSLHNDIKSALQENNYSLVIELSELAIEMEESK